MGLSPKLKKEYADRFDALVSEGAALRPRADRLSDSAAAAVVEWATKCASLLHLILPRDHPRRADLGSYGVAVGCMVNFHWQLGQLRGLRDDFNNGILDTIATRVSAEIASDYMAQAERLLAEGQGGSHDHVPAAVLCGAVLERSLRELCLRQNPPLPVAGPDGKPHTLSPLAQTLKKADVIKSTEKAQLDAWASIRNKAAHGE
ncbi:MAG: hypothetical protein ACOVP8_10700, partial [Phycisphaerales bacterium]